ncbi:DUF3219 family protein [Bacillus smithii]|uniref:DUF3219 domain-containing protein n=1 Tax=Bacillus smithii 7_3_47FAA TaxID=665952 RepID=G9QLD4_9BACI|nr:DUF3219 family protein [Bacillus smithii]EHL78050.1 hypothetical protein HMPREF1015_02944 [Bacillus smithii 7_3_47FAA]
MVTKVVLNGVAIQAEEFEEEVIRQNGVPLHKIRFAFKVRSNEYHDIATLLYEKTFDVSVPEKDLNFRGTIQNYSTSVTNLYKENEVADYRLELVETN